MNDQPDECHECGELRAARGAVSRRSVLRAVAAGGALSLVAESVDATVATQYAFGATTTSSDVLVVLCLRGGFDGLSAVVPAADPLYTAARPNVGVPQSQLLPLDATFGLHPSMAPLMPWWANGELGVVQDVGQADPTRSHFEAMAQLERASPGTAVRTGWLDRMLGLRPRGTTFQGAQVGSPKASGAFLGEFPEIALSSIDGFRLAGTSNPESRARTEAVYRALHANAPDAIAAPALVALDAVGTTTALKTRGYTPSSGAVYPASGLGKALRDVARLISADVGLQVASVDFGDWDVHANMGTVDSGYMTTHLGDLAGALAAFATDLGSALDGVTLVTLSEFGRRVVENGSGGTDHGHGNAVLLLGGGVVGGRVHGSWPGLAPAGLINGDLPGSTDYRQILAEILQKRCGMGSLSEVFPALSVSPLGVARARA